MHQQTYMLLLCLLYVKFVANYLLRYMVTQTLTLKILLQFIYLSYFQSSDKFFFTEHVHWLLTESYNAQSLQFAHYWLSAQLVFHCLNVIFVITFFHHPYQVLVTSHGELPDGTFIDPKSKLKFRYDHLRKVGFCWCSLLIQWITFYLDKIFTKIANGKI